MQEPKRWSDEELEILQENYGKKPLKDFRHLLPNRSDDAIRIKSSAMRLKGVRNMRLFNNVEVGKVYGKWKVIEKINSYTFICRCECGRTFKRIAQNLENDDIFGCLYCRRTKDGCGDIPYFILQLIKRGARPRDYDYNLEDEYLLELYHLQNKKCALTGEEISFSRNRKEHKEGKTTASLDRINSDKGYIKGNVQWVHKEINFLKSNLGQERFVKLCQMVADYSRSGEIG